MYTKCITASMKCAYPTTVTTFWGTKPRSLMHTYIIADVSVKHAVSIFRVQNGGNWGNKFLCNIRKYLSDYTMSNTRKLQSPFHWLHNMIHNLQIKILTNLSV
jgi:hypothetical protein